MALEYLTRRKLPSLVPQVHKNKGFRSQRLQAAFLQKESSSDVALAEKEPAVADLKKESAEKRRWEIKASELSTTGT